MSTDPVFNGDHEFDIIFIEKCNTKNKNCNIRDGFEYKNPIDSTISYM